MSPTHAGRSSIAHRGSSSGLGTPLASGAYRHLRSELRSAEPANLWRATADMLHLIDNPLIREGFFPPAEQRYAVEPAAERDGVAIAAIARRHEPPASADLLAAWLDAAPETFRVARDRDGQAVGVIALCEPSAVPLRVLDGDPVAAARRADLRRQPVRGGNVTITERAHQRRARRMIEPGDEQRSSLERLLRAAGPASL